MTVNGYWMVISWASRISIGSPNEALVCEPVFLHVLCLLVEGRASFCFSHLWFRQILLDFLRLASALRPLPPAPFSSSWLPFGRLGASFFGIPGDNFGTSGAFWGDNFTTSGPPWGTMGAAEWTRGGPEQDFHWFSGDFGISVKALWL